MLTFSDPDPLVVDSDAPQGDRPATSARIDLSPSETGAVPGAIGACVLRSTASEAAPDPVRSDSARTLTRTSTKQPGSKPETPTVRPGTGPSRDTEARNNVAGAATVQARASTTRRERGEVPATVPVNPKIARRRAEIRRTAHEVRRRRSLIALSFIGAVLLTVVVLLSPIVGVSTISVTGTDDTSRVVQASGIGFGSSLLRVSAHDVENRLKAIPEFADATVTKHWMRTVSIKVVPRIPVAMIVGPTNTILVAENGTAIQSVASTTASEYDLPSLDGVPPASVGRALFGDAAVLAHTAATLGPQARSATVAIRMDHGNVVLDLQPAANRAADGSTHVVNARKNSKASNGSTDGRISVVFGNPLELELKGRALEAMLVSNAMDGYRTADLGVPDAPVLGQ